MRGKRGFFGHADSRVRLSCRRLTGKQRILLAGTVSFLLAASCLYSILSCVSRFGDRAKDRQWDISVPSCSGRKEQETFIQTSINMKMDFQKIRERLGLSSDKPLTPEEKRRRAKYIVYPFLCLLCMGFLLLVFSPSEKEKAEMEKGKGFNVEMPSPEDSEMEGNKVSAYEQEALAKRKNGAGEPSRRCPNCSTRAVRILPVLLQEKQTWNFRRKPEKGKAPGSIRSSAEAYRNMNRSLGTVYTRNENQPDADLLRRIEDLEKERKPAEEQAEGQTLEEKMALLEKSYELAARYNGKEPDASSTANAPNSRKERTAVRPVKRVQNRMVSSLAQPAGNEDNCFRICRREKYRLHTR